MWSAQYLCPFLTKVSFCTKIFMEVFCIKFHENPSAGNQMVHVSGRTYCRDEANRRFSRL